MADEKTNFWIWGVILTAVTGLYAFFLRHVYKHVSPDEIKTLRNEVQLRSECKQIVKRIDENHKETNNKLDRILDKLNGVT